MVVFCCSGQIDTGAAEAGTLDPSLVIMGGPNNNPYDIAVQTDGRILMAGPFTEYNGQTNHYVVRLEPDGQLDSSFHIPVEFHHSDTAAYAIAIQPDGKILVGGTMFLGSLCSGCGSVVRLHSDGSVDTSFKSLLLGWTVVELALLQDGKIIAVGAIGSTGIVRLTATGATDPTFQPGTGADNGFVRAVALQEDGRIVVGGEFLSFNETGPRAIARLDADGAIDPTFSPIPSSSYPAYVNAIAVLPNGDVVYGSDRGDLVCLNSGGEAVWRRPASPVWDLLAQENGKVLVAGTGRPNTGDLMRVNGDGTVDVAFDSALNIQGVFSALALTMDSDGRILVSGWSDDSSKKLIRLWGDPRITPPLLSAFIEEAGFRIQISASNASQVVVEASSALGAWIPIRTNQIINGVAAFTDPDTGSARRFYRAVVAP